MTATAAQLSADFKVIAEPLDSLLSALENKIEREWPQRFAAVAGARELFLLTFRTANATYRSVRWLCAEKPPDPARRLDYCISVPPLNRTILDHVFTIIFLSEDLSARCSWYFKADWRETRLDLERYTNEYGDQPEWQEWLGKMKAYSDLGIAITCISPSEVASPASITRWPNPGAMVNYGINLSAPLPASRVLLKYLNDWFYADLSQQSHLGGGGLMKRAGALINDYRKNPQTEANLKKYRNAQVGQTVSLILALASELEVLLAFGLLEKIRYLWAVTTPFIVVAKEMHDKRYAALLGMNAGGVVVG